MAAFRPFGGRQNNTSEDVLRHLQRQISNRQNIPLGFVVLPVNFRTTWRTLRAAIEATSPDAVLLLGESRSSAVAIETTARNRRTYRKGDIPIEKSKPQLKTTLFNEALLAAFASKQSVSERKRWVVSHDAGNYLCNFSYWKVLTNFPALPSLFVHVPAMRTEESRRHVPMIARSVTALLRVIKMEVRSRKLKLSAQKQLTVPGQKAGRAKRKKGA